jgi:hypothetical protein
MADQEGGRVPRRCVRTGVPTEGAVHAWAVQVAHADVLWLVLGPLLRPLTAVARRPAARVVLPLSPTAWSALRGGLRWAVVVAGLGTGALVLGAVQADVALVVTGAVLLTAAWLLRALVLWRRWVGLVLRPGGDDVALTRVSPAFGEEARVLFLRAGRRSP